MPARPRPIRRVPQKDWEHNDCGIACVAMVTRRTYSAVLQKFRKLFPKKATALDYSTCHKDVEALVRKLGSKSHRRHFRGWREMSGLAIVKVNAKTNGEWHWVVYDGGRESATVHDPKPWKRALITDFRGLRGSGHYLRVTGRGER
jgi:ABC-type bacteriocin/lantibiotic exporter with double-glycine peptidase domain